MITEAVTSQSATRLELSEANAWIDMYQAAPDDYAQKYQLQIKRIRSVVILLCGVIPFPHFNCVLGLGLAEPATEKLVDDILTIFRDSSINNFYIHQIPHSQPQQLIQWLQSRSLRIKSGWDRIYRQNELLSSVESRNPSVERVTPDMAAEWADYISNIYGLPTAPWLTALVGRVGWHHYILRQDSEIAAARSMYLHHNGMAWLGIDAPVPGIMAPSYELDFQICHAIVEDGINLGAKYFIADIEAPSHEMATPAYFNFETLGFRRLYLRNNYGR